MSLDLKQKILQDLANSKKHLIYSYNKVKNFDLNDVDSIDEETLETLESFSSRFARYSDILVSKYFRFLAKEEDPAFRGSTVDLINFSEKMGWINSAQTWIRIRELRNLAAHEYEAADYKKLYQELIKLCPELLAIDF